MGRKAKWTTVEQLLGAYNNGDISKQYIQTFYFRSIRQGYIHRADYFKEVLDAIAQQEKEKK